jgi:hypothetical protein
MLMSGTILLEKGALCPQCFQIEDGSHPYDWMSVKHNLTPRALEEELAAKGWTFFYLAGAIKKTAFGFDRPKMINTALKRVIADVRLQKCNSLEIEEVETQSILGIPYVNVSAHPRHIQKGMVLSLANNAEVRR